MAPQRPSRSRRLVASMPTRPTSSRCQSQLSGTEGFTLIEALASIGLLSVVILGTAIGADRATRYTEYSRTATTAMTLVHDEIEQLQAKGSTEPEFTVGNHADPNNPITSLGTANG